MNDSFLFYRSWLEIINDEYADESTRSALIVAIVTYGVYGKKTYPTEKMFLRQCYAQIDSAIDKHNKAVTNGRKGGKANKNKGALRVLKANENENSNENDNDNISSFGNSLDGNASEEKDWRDDIE